MGRCSPEIKLKILFGPFCTVLFRRLSEAAYRRRRSNWQVEAELANVFGDLAAVFAAAGQTVSGDAISEVRRVETRGKGYYAKLYHVAGKGLRRWFGRSRIRSEWENLQRMEAWGVPVPRIVARGEWCDEGGYRGAMVTAELLGSAGLDAIAAERLAKWGDRTWRHGVLAQVARHVAVLHAHRFAHGDLNWRNLLVVETTEPRIYFIDCPAGQRWAWPLWGGRQARDLWMLDKLGRQYLSRSERLRFFLLYRGKRRLDAADKSLLRRIVAKSTGGRT